MSTRRSSLASTRRPTARLSLAATLRGVRRTYREQWRFLLPTALLVFVPLGLLEAAVDHLRGFKIEDVDAVTGIFVSAAALASFLASGLGDQFYAGAVAAAEAESRGRARRPTLLQIARRVSYLSLIVVDVIVAIGTAVGLVLFVVPGIVFYTWFGLAAPVIEIERLGPWTALRRSRQLVRGNFWPVLLLLGLSEAASDGLTSLGQDEAVSALGHSLLGDWAAAVVVGVVITPLIAVVAVVMTYELMELQAAPAPPS